MCVIPQPSRDSLSPVFLTGATGFIGRHLTRALFDAGCEVAALALPEELGGLSRHVHAYIGDVADRALLSRAISDAKPKVVYHLAAVGLTNPGLPMVDACQVNVLGMIHLLDAVRIAGGTRRLVLVGSSYEYGGRRSDDDLDPFNAYSASKVAAWAFARAAYNAWKSPVVWVRPFQVYGPGQPDKALVPAAVLAAIRGRNLLMTRGEQQRDFVVVGDVVEGLLLAGSIPGLEGRTLDLATGQLHAVRSVVDRIWSMTGATGRILAGAVPYRAGEVTAIPANTRRTRLLTGWEAKTSLDDGLRLVVDSLRQREAAGPRGPSGGSEDPVLSVEDGNGH